MFAIRSAPDPGQKGHVVDRCCTPNILPCRIHHDGPVDNVGYFWKPEVGEKGQSWSDSVDVALAR